VVTVAVEFAVDVELGETYHDGLSLSSHLGCTGHTCVYFPEILDEGSHKSVVGGLQVPMWCVVGVNGGQLGQCLVDYTLKVFPEAESCSIVSVHVPCIFNNGQECGIVQGLHTIISFGIKFRISFHEVVVVNCSHQM